MPGANWLLILLCDSIDLVIKQIPDRIHISCEDAL